MLDILACTFGNVNLAESAYIFIPKTIALVVDILKIIVPIILVIFGMIDLMKAVMSNDEKEMKGAQTKLIKRVIYAVAVFLVVSIVQIIFGALGNTTGSDVDSSTISGCISCFINGDC